MNLSDSWRQLSWQILVNVVMKNNSVFFFSLLWLVTFLSFFFNSLRERSLKISTWMKGTSLSMTRRVSVGSWSLTCVLCSRLLTRGRESYASRSNRVLCWACTGSYWLVNSLPTIELKIVVFVLYVKNFWEVLKQNAMHDETSVQGLIT